MDGVLGLVVRWRVGLLAGALLGTLGYEIGQVVAGFDPAWPVTLVVELVLPFGLLMSSVLVARNHHPAVLVARPRVSAVEAPPNPWMVLGAVGYTMLGGRTVGTLAEDLADGAGFGFSLSFVVFYLLCVGAMSVSSLGRFGVRLTPDGITSREVLGSVFVPWEALGEPRPAFAYDAQQVTLTVADPGRVRKRGLRFGSVEALPAAGVSAELLARAIHEYANRPELRPAIGTEAELARFMGIPQIAGMSTQP